jgi:hypothetical protein
VIAAQWTFATVLGLTAAGLVLHFPGDRVTSGLNLGLQSEAAIVGTILGAISGAFVGLIQWLAVRPVVGRAGLLALAMVAGIAVTHGLADGGGAGLGPLGVALVGGLVIGAGFAVAGYGLGGAAIATLGWAFGIVAAYWVADAAGLPATQDPSGWATQHTVIGAVTGTVWGLATGWFLGTKSR